MIIDKIEDFFRKIGKLEDEVDLGLDTITKSPINTEPIANKNGTKILFFIAITILLMFFVFIIWKAIKYRLKKNDEEY